MIKLSSKGSPTLALLWILGQLATAIYSFLFNESPPPPPPPHTHTQTTIYIIIIELVDISTFLSRAVKYHKILYGVGVIAWALGLCDSLATTVCFN